MEGFDEKVFYFGRNLHDHLDVAGRNLAGEDAPLFERSVHYGSLPASAVDELAELVEDAGMQLLEAINRRSLELRSDTEPGSAPEPGGSERMNFGLYFYRGPELADPDPTENAAVEEKEEKETSDE